MIIKQTILMATMELDLGGAETHIVELCRGLQKQGFQIVVVSHGGLYEEKLEAEGIVHVTAPLHTRNVLAMVKSYRIIKETILKYQIQIVHAHARIPAFICGIVKRSVPFHFFTTAHGAHSTAFPLVLLSDWGEKTFAVADDLKDYLINNYDMAARDILMTVNGIDTESYHPNISGEDLLREFNLNENNRRILSVSRLDTDMSLTPHTLIYLAPRLNELYGDIDIIIIGQGNDFNSVATEAAAMNAQIGRDMILITGARYDVNKWLSIADVFVNVSRSALEAMATEIPVILSGNQGYIGIFSEETLDIARESNFTGRGATMIVPETILGDIQTLLDAPPEALKKLGAYGREVVKTYYSVDTMVTDAKNLYLSVSSTPPTSRAKTDICISGYYGFHNSGDDTLLHVIISQLFLEAPYLKLQVFSRRPKETKKVYGIQATFMFNLFAIRRQLGHSKLLLTGGGTLIQDLTSIQSLLYYLLVIYMAHKKGVKTMLYANGIGPIRPKNEKLVAKILNKMDYITLRDQDSYELLQKIGVHTPPIMLTTDAAFGIEHISTGKGRATLESFALTEGRYFCVSVRAWQDLPPDFTDMMVTIIDYIQETYELDVIFIPMQPMNDRQISMDILSKLRQTPPTRGHYLGDSFSLEEILYIEEKAVFVMAMRLHTLIYALIGATPSLALSYDPKVNGLMNDFGQPYIVHVANMDMAMVMDMADDIIKNHKDIRKDLARKVKKANELSHQTAKIAIQLWEEANEA